MTRPTFSTHTTRYRFKETSHVTSHSIGHRVKSGRENDVYVIAFRKSERVQLVWSKQAIRSKNIVLSPSHGSSVGLWSTGQTPPYEKHPHFLFVSIEMLAVLL